MQTMSIKTTFDVVLASTSLSNELTQNIMEILAKVGRTTKLEFGRLAIKNHLGGSEIEGLQFAVRKSVGGG